MIDHLTSKCNSCENLLEQLWLQLVVWGEDINPRSMRYEEAVCQKKVTVEYAVSVDSKHVIGKCSLDGFNVMGHPGNISKLAR